jgi:putative flippase GtrA
MTQPSQLDIITKMFRFAVIGIANAGLDFLTYWILVSNELPPLLANVAGWFVAVIFSYLLNSKLTFTLAENHSKFVAFLSFVGLGAIITLGVSSWTIWLLAPLTGPYYAKLLGLCIAAVLNFFAARWSIEKKS